MTSEEEQQSQRRLSAFADQQVSERRPGGRMLFEGPPKGRSLSFYQKWREEVSHCISALHKKGMLMAQE